MDNDFEEFLDRLDKSPPKKGKWLRPGVYTDINEMIKHPINPCKSIADVQPMTKPGVLRCIWSVEAREQAMRWVEDGQ